MSDLLTSLSRSRRDILVLLKRRGRLTTAQIAAQLDMSDEGARQHLVYLESMGWIVRGARKSEPPRSGRPTAIFALSESGDNLFPKRYDALSVTLIDTIVKKYGDAALRDTLADITDAQVKAWEPRMEGKSLKERLELLKGFYLADDPYTTIETNGATALVEHNCPFRNVAMSRPQLCSTTVSTLTRLLGVRVDRRARFQNGDGCCRFYILTDQPVDPDRYRFEFEDEDEEKPAGD